MNNKRTTWLAILVATVLIITMLATFGCSSKTTPSTAAPAPAPTSTATSAPTTPAASTAAPAPAPTSAATAAPTTPAASTAAPQVLKIGYLDDFAFASGVDMIKILGIYSEMYKEQGGLDIGGQKYQVQFIPYDHKGVQSSAMSALNKLIFEDKVKYIITTFTPLADGWLPVTEQNKVIFVDVSVTPPIYDPKYNYCFEAGGLPCQAMVGPYFFSQMFPNMKDVVIAGPDSQMGHMGNDNAMKIMTFSGMKVTEIFYPASSSDLSSLGTKVAGINPPVVVCQGGGPTVDSLAQKAIYNAGWRGQFFTAPASPVGQLKAVTPPEVLEGQIVGAIPCEFTPCLNDAATDFMARWLAKYNKYEGQILGSVQWDAIRTAMQKAGSTDVDKVADVLHNGLQYSGVGGDMQMIPRMDFGDSRTNGSAQVIYMKKIVKGEPQLIGTFSLADSVAMMNKYYVKK